MLVSFLIIAGVVSSNPTAPVYHQLTCALLALILFFRNLIGRKISRFVQDSLGPEVKKRRFSVESVSESLVNTIMQYPAISRAGDCQKIEKNPVISDIHHYLTDLDTFVRNKA